MEFIEKATDIYYGVDDDGRLEIRNKFPHQIISKKGEFLQDNIQDKAKTVIYK